MPNPPFQIPSYVIAQGARDHAQRPVTSDEVVGDLIARIKEIEASLAADRQVEVVVNGYGIRIKRFAHSGRGLVEIVGEDATGQPCMLIQHVSQLSLLLRAANTEAGQQRRPIGFDVR